MEFQPLNITFIYLSFVFNNQFDYNIDILFDFVHIFFFLLPENNCHSFIYDFIILNYSRFYFFLTIIIFVLIEYLRYLAYFSCKILIFIYVRFKISCRYLNDILYHNLYFLIVYYIINLFDFHPICLFF